MVKTWTPQHDILAPSGPLHMLYGYKEVWGKQCMPWAAYTVLTLCPAMFLCPVIAIICSASLCTVVTEIPAKCSVHLCEPSQHMTMLGLRERMAPSAGPSIPNMLLTSSVGNLKCELSRQSQACTNVSQRFYDAHREW